MASIISAGTTDSTSLNVSSDKSGILQLASNNGTVGVTLDTASNVGIGTSSPSGKFDILGSNVSTSNWGNVNVTSRNTISAVDRIYTALRLQDSGSSDAGAIGYSYNGTGYNMMFATVPGVGGALTERMRIDSVGNVLATGGFIPGNTSRLVVRGFSPGSYNNTFSQSNATVQILSNEMNNDTWNPTLNITTIRQSLTTGKDSFGGIGFSTIDDSNDSGMNDAGRIAIVNETPSAVASGTAMAFYTQAGSVTRTNAATERLRINSSGNLLIKCTANPSASVYGSGFIDNGVGASVLYQSTSITSANALQVFYNPNGNVGSVGTSGSNAYYSTTSDYRLKENIAPMTGALDKVALLKPCTYTWKSSQENSQGFIAHELAEVCPQAVVGEKDAVNAEGNPQYQSIDTSFLVATLTAALQETKALIDTQAETINALTARIEALENK
jgi:hypothetical protein